MKMNVVDWVGVFYSWGCLNGELDNIIRGLFIGLFLYFFFRFE